MADKDGTERRVYVLPADLVDRIKAYQTNNGIGSEVEAVRRLLHYALQMRESVTDILNSLKAKFEFEKDLRVLARDVLANHATVTKIVYTEPSVIFHVKSGDVGSIDSKGRIYSGEDQDFLSPVPESPAWAAPRKADLDDEIPF